MKLTIESALKNQFMKEQVMLTEAEWSLQRGHFDYWVATEAGKVSLALHSKTWEDILWVSISLHHEEERSCWLIEATAIDPYNDYVEEPIELPSTLCHIAQDVGHEVHKYFQHLPKLVEEALNERGENPFITVAFVEALREIKAENVTEGWAVR
ncbi:hypothetical protein [Bacillus mycoides]|uniref:hypothetical protein n=1 Tax=Bacillus mycoides TaxID=1405 RepID=UPI002E1F7B90|nr:hypothetical protein [Bacillus mycoides]